MARKVLITYKIMPETVDSNLEEIKNNIMSSLKEKCEVKDIKEEPIAFGLRALKILVMVEDKQGIADEIEKILSEIDGVESVESEGITLI